MLRLHSSNRLEALAEVFLARFAEVAHTTADPLQPVHVVVPSMGTGQWLRQHMAESLGIAAQLDVQLPASFAWQVFRAFDPTLPGESEYALERLRWRLFHLLPMLHEPTFAPLRTYLADVDEDRAQRKRYQLATRLAVLFDQYLVYRRDWIAAFEGAAFRSLEDAQRFAAEPWQPALWRRLVADVGGAPHRARVFEEVLARVLDPGVSLPAQVPGWVSVFGVPALPPDLVLLFGALSQRLEVDVFMPNACRKYWADIVSARTLALLEIRQAHNPVANASPARGSLFDPAAETHYFETGHPLLASCGRMNREGVDLLNELVEALGEHATGNECFVEPAQATMLARLQLDILDLRSPADLLSADDAAFRLGEHDGDRRDDTAVAPDDDSLELHQCHSALREVEVLHDRLLSGFAADPSLEPRHVVVMVPDLETYAPLIEAVFNSVPEKRRIRVAIADRLDEAAAPVLAALRQLLQLDSSRWTASEVLSLLDIPAVQARFDLADERLQQARHWLREAGVRWGRDAGDWRRRDLPVLADDPVMAEGAVVVPQGAARGEQPNTWAFGLERLLLGYAMPDAVMPDDAMSHRITPVGGPDDGAVLFDGVAPVAGVEGQAARALDGVLRLLDELGRIERELHVPVDAAGWQQRIERWVTALFAPARDDADAFLALRGLRDALRRLVADQPPVTVAIDGLPASSAGDARAPADSQLSGDPLLSAGQVPTPDSALDVALPLAPLLGAAVVREYLEDAWRATSETPRYLTGAVTVCTLLPMRSIPFAHVHLLGMNERDFPRQATPPSFDLMAHGGRRKGDRVRRDEDRQLFLDAVLSARTRLHLSHVGESDRSGQPRNPSVLVSELLEVLLQRFRRMDDTPLQSQLVHRHPLQPFSTAYDGKALVTYEDLWTRRVAKIAAAWGSSPSPPEPVREVDEVTRVSPATLRQFLRRPATWYLRNVLDVRVPDEIDTLDDDEPMALDALERHGLASDALAALREGRFAAWAARVRASGLLPHGLAGAQLLEGWRNELGALLERDGARAPTAAVPVDLRLQAADVEGAPGSRRDSGWTLHVQGDLERIGPLGYLYLRVGKVNPRDLADAYVAQLLLCASDMPADSVLMDVEKTHGLAPIPRELARKALLDLGALYRAAGMQPLPLFVHTAQALVTSDDEAKALAAWGIDADRGGFSERYSSAERLGDDVQLLWGDCVEPPEGWQDCARRAYSAFERMLGDGKAQAAAKKSADRKEKQETDRQESKERTPAARETIPRKPIPRKPNAGKTDIGAQASMPQPREGTTGSESDAGEGSS